MGHKIDWEKWSEKLEKIKHWLMLLLVRSASPKWSQYVRWVINDKYPKRIFSWISLQNRRCFQTVGLMLGEAALLRRVFWKTKLVIFSVILSFLKSNTELEKKEVDPCNVTHAFDTIVKNGILFNRIQKEKKWAGWGMVVLISIIFISF